MCLLLLFADDDCPPLVMPLFSFLSSFSVGERVKNMSLLTRVRCEEEEEIVDPQVVLRDECKVKHCEKYDVKLATCNDRVNSRQNTAETCYEELLDLFHCIDHCVSKDLFKKLK